MKKVLTLLAAICLVSYASVNSFAGLPEGHNVELGSEVSYIKYEEPDVMEEKGIMYGINGSYAYRNKFMLKTDGKFSYGQVDYKNSGTIDNIDDYMFEFRLVGGYDFPVLKATTLTPYIGIGYRYLNDDTSGMTSSTGALGYERESNYYYSPVGLETNTKLDNGWSVGLAIEYDYFWKGVQKSHLSDVSAGFNDLENDQKEGFGVRGSIKLQKETENIEFILEPFVRYWNIDKSEEQNVIYAGAIVGYGYEPQNNSLETGVKVGILF